MIQPCQSESLQNNANTQHKLGEFFFSLNLVVKQFLIWKKTSVDISLMSSFTDISYLDTIGVHLHCAFIDCRLIYKVLIIDLEIVRK